MSLPSGPEISDYFGRLRQKQALAISKELSVQIDHELAAREFLAVCLYCHSRRTAFLAGLLELPLVKAR